MMHNGSVPKVLKRVIINSKLMTIGMVLTIIGSIVLGLLPPLALEQIINRLTKLEPISLGLALMYFILLTASGLADAGSEAFITIFGQKITHSIRSELCAKLSRLSAGEYIENDPGVTVSRFVNDAETVEALFTSGVISMVTDACKVLGILVIIFIKSLGLGLLMLIVIPVLFWFTRFIQKKMLSAQIDNRTAVGKVSNHVPETIQNIRMIHAFRKEEYMEKRYDEYIQDSYAAMEKSNFCASVYSPAILVASALVVATMMCLAASGGGMRSLFGISVGTAVAIIAYVGKVFGPLESIGMEIQTVQSAIAGVARIESFLSLPERKLADLNISAETLTTSDTPRAELANVCFAYQNDQSVLHGLSFKVNTGENVTLTGRTGIGKSTVFKLLLGLYSPSSGFVHVCGKDADIIPDGVKRELFGYVEQSFRMVPGNIADQITLFDRTITINAVEKACQIVGLEETIRNLPNGLQTVCTEALFSQGQWQLLSIARAIAANPPILLLDEITANLDSGTEEVVLNALHRVSINRTVISISHRQFSRFGGREIAIEA